MKPEGNPWLPMRRTRAECEASVAFALLAAARLQRSKAAASLGWTLIPNTQPALPFAPRSVLLRSWSTARTDWRVRCADGVRRVMPIHGGRRSPHPDHNQLLYWARDHSGQRALRPGRAPARHLR